MIPAAHDYHKQGDIEIIKMDRIYGEHISHRSIASHIQELIYKLLFISRMKIVHGDIKKENIIISDDGKVFLIDFNQSYHTEESLHGEDINGNNGMNLFSLMKNLRNPSPENLTNQIIKSGLHSTGSSKPYYSWLGRNFQIDGERSDQRASLFYTIDGIEDFYGQRVVDVGCNLGMMSHMAVNLGAASCHGFEGDAATATWAEKLVKFDDFSDRIKIKNQNLAMEEITSEYDVAMCFSVLHHINPRDKIFDFLNRINRTIFIESHYSERPYGSSFCPGQEWDFQNYEQMISYLETNLPNFKFDRYIGETDDRVRPRQILKFTRDE